MLVPLEDGRYEAPSPALLRAAEEATARGVGLAAALHVVEEVQAGCAGMARAFVSTFTQELLRPGLPEDAAVAAVERLRPWPPRPCSPCSTRRSPPRRAAPSSSGA